MARNHPSVAAALPLLTRALEQEIGLSFIADGMPREQYRQLLYETRATSGDPRLQELIIFAPAAPHENEIWIAKKEVQLDD